MADTARKLLAEGLPPRRPAVVSCWMCGIHLHQNQMVADGGSACDDIRWYCKDARACSERWVTARRQAPATGVA